MEFVIRYKERIFINIIMLLLELYMLMFLVPIFEIFLFVVIHIS